MIYTARARFATVVLALGALAPAPCLAQDASAYPNKPVRLIVSTVAGSQPDMIARTIAQKMSESWGRPVVMENRPGGGGLLAATLAQKATPDGHTLFYTLPNFTITPALQGNAPYALKDFVGISQIGMSTNAFVVSTALNVKSVGDLIALAKAQPGKVIFASSATGSASHLSGVRFNLLAGIKVVTVAYKGGPEATIEVLAGRAHFHVSTMGVALPFIKEGKLLALAVTSPQRSPVVPDVPALGEIMPEFRKPETSHALLAPAGTPRGIVERLNREVARILDLPDVKERLQTIGFIVAPTTPEECTKILRAQLDTLSRLVVDAGLKPK